MTPREGSDCERNIYVLARALCSEGKVRVSRKERLTLALVELRDRIRQEFVKVAKDWQVPAQELRRDYSYAYPVPAPGEPDPLCLENACEQVIVDLRSSIVSCAEQYGVPDDLVESVLVSWLVSDLAGKERAPAGAFMPERRRAAKEVEEGLPMVTDVLRLGLARASGAMPGEEGE